MSNGNQRGSTTDRIIPGTLQQRDGGATLPCSKGCEVMGVSVAVEAATATETAGGSVAGDALRPAPAGSVTVIVPEVPRLRIDGPAAPPAWDHLPCVESSLPLMPQSAVWAAVATLCLRATVGLVLGTARRGDDAWTSGLCADMHPYPCPLLKYELVLSLLRSGDRSGKIAHASQARREQQ